MSDNAPLADPLLILQTGAEAPLAPPVQQRPIREPALATLSEYSRTIDWFSGLYTLAKASGLEKTEEARQTFAGIVNAIDPSVSLETAYKNPYHFISKLTGEDVADKDEDWLNTRLQAYGDAWTAADTQSKIDRLYAVKADTTAPGARVALDAKIESLKKTLPGPDVFAGGLGDGVLRDLTGFGDDMVKLVAGAVSGIAQGATALPDNWGTGGIAAALLSAQRPEGWVEAEEYNQSLLRTTGILPMLPTQAQDLRDQRQTVVPELALRTWALGAVPLFGPWAQQMRGAVAAQMEDAGVDPKLTQKLSAVAGAADTVVNALTLSQGWAIVEKALGKANAKQVAEEAVRSGMTRFIAGGGIMKPLVDKGLVRLETSATGKVVKYVAGTAAEAVDVGAAPALVQALSDGAAVNVAIDLTNALIRQDPETVEAMKALGVVSQTDVDRYIGDNIQQLSSKWSEVVPGAIRAAADGFAVGAMFAGGARIGGSLLRGKAAAQMTPSEARAIDESVMQEHSVATGPAATPEASAAFREPDTSGVAPEILTGYIVTGADQSKAQGAVGRQAPRVASGMRVVTGEAPAFEAAPIDPGRAIEVIRAKVPQTQADAFAQTVRTGEISGAMDPELRVLAQSIHAGDVGVQTLAVANRYGIETPGATMAQVEVRAQDFPTLSATEMKNPGPVIEAYRARGVSGVRAGAELYVFKPEAVQKVGDVVSPAVMAMDPVNSKTTVSRSSVQVESAGQTMDLPIDRSAGSARVTGEVGPFVAPMVARALVDANEGVRIEADSPALRREIEALNPEAPAIRERIGALETKIDDMESAGKTEGLDRLKQDLEQARAELTTPTPEWKQKAAHQMSRAEFETQAAQTLAERQGALGNSLKDQILKAAPHVTDDQAKALSDLVDRIDSRTAGRLIEAVLHDDTVVDEKGNPASGAADQVRRVMKLGTDASFDTVFEETVHLARTLLTPDQRRTLIDELGLETQDDGFTLTRAGEESFVDAARIYLKQKTGASPMLDRVITFLRDILDAIRGRISDKAMAVFDELFGENDTLRHDQSREVGLPGSLESGEGTQSESGMVPAGGAEALANLGDRPGEPGQPSVADPDNEGRDPGDLFQTSTQSEHERILRKALKDGKWVPDHVLEEYLDKPWALEEWERRHPAELRELERTAITTATADDFVSFVVDSPFFDPTALPEAIQALSLGEQKVELAAYWDRIHNPTDGRAQANNTWTAKMETDAGLKNWVASLAGHEDALVGKSLPGALFSAISSVAGGGEVSPKAAKAIRTAAKNYPDAMREAQLEATRDEAGLEAFRREAEWKAVKAEMDLATGQYDPEAVIQDQRAALRMAAGSERAAKASLAEALSRVKWQSKAEAEGRLEVRRTSEALADELRDLSDQVVTGETRKTKTEKRVTDTHLEASATRLDENATPAEKAGARTARSSLDALQNELSRAEKTVRAGAKDALEAVRSAMAEAAKLEKDETVARIEGQMKATIDLAKEKIHALSEALSAARAEHELSLKRVGEARREKATMEKLAAQIMRPISRSTVHVSMWRPLRSIQERLDPKFRQDRTHERRSLAKEDFETLLKFARDGYQGGPFRSEEGLRRASAMADKKSLDQFTLEELATVADQFNAFYKDGQAKLAAKKHEFEALRDKTIARLLAGMRKTKKLRDGGGAINAQASKAVEGTAADKLRTLVHDPQRIFDYLDGGQDFKGANHDVFYRGVDEAVNAEIRMEQEFLSEFEHTLVQAGFKSLDGKGPSVSQLYKEIEVRGQKWQVQEIMDVYLKWKNDRSRAALVGDGARTGNRIDQSLHDELVAQLTSEQKAVADWILDWYNRPETKTKLAVFHEDFANTEFIDEENYTPIERIGNFKERSDVELKAELMGRSQRIMGTIEKGMTKERVDIAAHNQTRLKLGAIDTLITYQHQTAHYMSHAEITKLLDAVYADPEFKAAATERVGRVGLELISKYIERVKNPNIDKDPSHYFRTFRTMAGNIAKAYMAYNPKTILRQIPAFLYFMGELDNPLMLLKGIKDVNVGWGEAWAKMSELSPQWATRVQDPIMREIINGTKDNWIKMVGDTGMTGIGAVDQVVAGWGWWAKFQEGKGKKLSDAEAARAADEAMNRTQQVSRTKDQSELYSQKDFLKWFTMFTGPLNKVFNQMSYDTFNRPGGARKGFTVLGVFTAAFTGWCIANGKAPESDEDWKQVIGAEFLGAPIPLFGQGVANYYYGFDRTGRLSPWEFLEEGLDALKAIQNAADGEWTPEEAAQKFIDKSYGAFALATGAPLVEVRRVFQIMKDAADGKEIDVRDLVGKGWGRGND